MISVCDSYRSDPSSGYGRSTMLSSVIPGEIICPKLSLPDDSKWPSASVGRCTREAAACDSADWDDLALAGRRLCRRGGAPTNDAGAALHRGAPAGPATGAGLREVGIRSGPFSMAGGCPGPRSCLHITSLSGCHGNDSVLASEISVDPFAGRPMWSSALLPIVDGFERLASAATSSWGCLSTAACRPFVPSARLVAREMPCCRGIDQISVCSEISRASSTSMPRYLTVDSNLDCSRRSRTARIFLVR